MSDETTGTFCGNDHPPITAESKTSRFAVGWAHAALSTGEASGLCGPCLAACLYANLEPMFMYHFLRRDYAREDGVSWFRAKLEKLATIAETEGFEVKFELRKMSVEEIEGPGPESGSRCSRGSRSSRS